MSEFSQVTHPIARRNYRCEWCGETIFKGELHRKFAGNWQDEFQSYRMHSECEDAMQYDPDIAEDGFTPFDNERPKPAPLLVGFRPIETADASRKG